MGKASTETRDKIRQLNAKEWESFTGTVKQAVSPRSCVKLDVQELLSEKKSKLPQPEKKNYKSEIYRIFNLYYDELSASFRPPAIPPPKEQEGDASDLPTCYENDDSYSELSFENLETCPVAPLRSKKQFSMSRPAQIPLSVHRMRKTKNTGAEKSEVQTVSWVGRRRSIVSKLEINTFVPVTKRNSCPILRQRRTLNNQDEMAAFKLESLNEDIEEESLVER